MEEWEVSKENVQPQRKGRDAALLSRALQTKGDELEEQRRRAMAEIETYTGEDPLRPWLRAIRWAKESHPSGGPQLLSLLEQCARAFKADARYKDDKRYLTVWVQYADSCPDPGDIFSFLEANGIGHSHALLYEAHATFLESRRCFAQANDAYQLGVARQAQPLPRLQNMYRSFMERMDRRHKRQQREAQEQEQEGQSQNLARSFGQRLAGRSRRPGEGKSPLQRPGNVGLQVFVDAEFGGGGGRGSAGGAGVGGLGGWQNLGTEAERRKENVQRPGKWTEAKIGGGKGQQQQQQQQVLEVFVDEELRGKGSGNGNGNGEERKPVPATLRLRHDDVGVRREEGLRRNPLQHFGDEGDSGAGVQVREERGYRLETVGEDGVERSFEEVRVMRWREGVEKEREKNGLDSEAVRGVGVVSKGVAVLDWLNKSPVIKLPEGGGGGREGEGGGGQTGEARSGGRKGVGVGGGSGVEGMVVSGNGEETMAIRRIAQEAIILGVDPEVGTAAQHRGLVDPTINTKEAMDDIISMFQSDLPCERKRRTNGDAQASRKMGGVFGSQNVRGGNGRGGKQGFQIYMDEELSGKSVSKASKDLPRALKFGDDSKSGFQVYVDEELGGQSVAKGGQNVRSGKAGQPQGISSSRKSLKAGEKKQGFQVYVDDELAQRSTRKVAVPSSKAGAGVVDLKRGDKGRGLQVFMDEEFGGQNGGTLGKDVKSGRLGQVQVSASKSSRRKENQEVYLEHELPRCLKFEEETAEVTGGRGDGKQSFLVYVDEDLERGQEQADAALPPEVSPIKLPAQVSEFRLGDGKQSLEEFMDEELGSIKLSGGSSRSQPGYRVEEGAAEPMVFQDENLAPSPSVAMLESEKEDNAGIGSLKLEVQSRKEERNSDIATPKPRNPWDEGLLVELLDRLRPSMSSSEEFYVSSSKYPGSPLSSLRKNPRGRTLELEGRGYYIKSCAGQGSFAQVYLADDYEEDEEVVLKVQKPCWPWEFYIYSQVATRIPAKERDSFGHALRMHCYSDYSIMVCKYGEHGTLQDVVNAYLAKGEKMHEILCIFYTIEMLRMLENLHAAGLIHGDFKPDNLLIRRHNESFQNWSPDRPGCWQHEGLCLIDWGRSIDLSLFPPGTSFLADCRTEAFRCTEMLEERPWTFQIDTYGLCVVAHCLLHGSYLEVKTVPNPAASRPTYQPKAAYKRYWNVELWKNLFDTLLNVDNCDSNPPLGPIRKAFEDYLTSNPPLIRRLSELLMSQNLMMFKR